MVKKVLVWPDSSLRRISRPIEVFDGSVRELEKDLVETAEAYSAAGLAAIQIGVPLRAFVVYENFRYTFMANPVVDFVDDEDLELMEEGCLSFPGVREDVMRHRVAHVTYSTAKGERRVVGLQDLPAQAVQHEYDHLDGILLPDKLAPVRRDVFLRLYKKRGVGTP